MTRLTGNPVNPSPQHTIRIATRKSPLALWQAETIRDALLALHDNLQVELLPMSTRGDKILDAPLAKVGTKRLGSANSLLLNLLH